MIHGHGNNLYEYKGLIRHDFSSNIAFNNKSEEILNFVKENMDAVKNYPDPEAKELTEKIAERYGVDPRSVLVTNGSAEAFYLIAHFLQGAKTAICIPAFAEYEDACKLYRHACSYIPIRQFGSTDFSSYKSVWLGNPNNPDGVFTNSRDIQEQCLRNSKTMFVIDQAYRELTDCKKEIENYGTQPANLISVSSLTKSFAIPGIRLGYIIASPDIIAQLSAMRPPWSVNSLALIAGTYIVDNYSRLLPNLQELIESSYYLQEKLSKNQLIEVYPSPCNFFLSFLKKGMAEELKNTLINRFGILIRDASNFRGLNTACFRLSAQNRISNNELINAINIILDE